LASDHGEGLGQHGEEVHGLFIYNSTVHVPFLLKLPGEIKPAKGTINQIVNTVDIAPALTHACGLGDSTSFQGRTLLPLLQSGPAAAPREAYSESLYPRTSFGWHSLHGIETDQYHYIDAPQEELYDVRLDPGETRNIAHLRASIITATRSISILATSLRPWDWATPPWTAEIRQAL